MTRIYFPFHPFNLFNRSEGTCGEKTYPCGMMKRIKRRGRLMQQIAAAATMAMMVVGKPPVTQWRSLLGGSVRDKFDSFLELINS
jgi:hypothetical protein